MFGDRPASASTSPYWVNRVGKKARTAWPKRIGSETFIIVALRCREKSTPCSFAAAICSRRKVSSAATRMTVESTTSPASTGTDGLSTVSVPSAATCTIERVSSASITTDCSLERKSSAPIVATEVLESLLHSPMRWGCFLAKFFTAAGARRSELPSRRTGFTAEPLTES